MIGTDSWAVGGMLQPFQFLIGFGFMTIIAMTSCRQPQLSSDPFKEVAEETGLIFQHFNGMSGKFYIAEIMGSGAALFDYDQDGDLDIYLVQGAVPPPELADQSVPADLELSDRCFQNQLVETGQLSFVDVTDQLGLGAREYGMGVAVGDYDADGWPDLYVTALGANHLYHNKGDGTFEDVTQQAGVGDERWSVPAAFVDLNGDGLQVLYVGNYLDFNFYNNQQCQNNGLDYCNPLSYASQTDRLWLNQGDGTFLDISESSGLSSQAGNSLGVIARDLTGDGLVDLYVANDGQANFFWVNQGENRFKESALLSGCALNMAGQPEASMGIDAADFDGDGDEDLFMTHLAGETNTLYLNNGKGQFEDGTIAAGLSNVSKASTGFGTAFFDYDNDGRLDLLVANGAVTLLPEQVAAGLKHPLNQPNQLFGQTEAGSFKQITGGQALALSEVSRGAAFGDLDNDGDTDVVITNNQGPVRLLRNEVGHRRPWLGVILKHSDRWFAEEVAVAIEHSDGSLLWRRARTAASYACANDPRVLFGLARPRAVVALLVIWPDGVKERFPVSKINVYQSITRGSPTPRAH